MKLQPWTRRAVPQRLVCSICGKEAWGTRHPCSGEGRSAARPDLVSEAWALDRPPALFSKVEENLRRRSHDSLDRQSLPETMQRRAAGTTLVPGDRHAQPRCLWL